MPGHDGGCQRWRTGRSKLSRGPLALLTRENPMKRALIVGNSDGIGLAVTRALLLQDYDVVGVSRRAAPIDHARYVHIVQDVAEAGYRERLQDILARHPDLSLCIYCAGIGDNLALDKLAF